LKRNNRFQAIIKDAIVSTYIRDNADAMPQAVPRTKRRERKNTTSVTEQLADHKKLKEGLYTLFVPNISGVHPYNTAHIV
jgi:hypothetical protein